ncbi:MAG: D-aminoacyl-tRNA deacylase [Candidatus Kapabacteria bacterium]|nr:D-aminoacyl-tRNA deacylase [Candidatus Kapabacteria bacterium]
MKAVVQRVKKAKVTIDNEVVGEIGAGLLVLVAIHEEDTTKTLEWMANKLENLRIFEDNDGKMNRSVKDISGKILVVSNFTVYGDTAKGYRPSYSHSAPPQIAEPLFEQFVDYLRTNFEIPIATGRFGAMMDVELVNDGPVTLIIEK